MTKRSLTPGEAAGLLLTALEQGRGGAAILVTSDPAGRLEGGRVLVLDGNIRGSLGDGRADEAAVRLALAGLEGDPGALPGLHPLPLEDGGKVEVFLELHHPQAELVIVGAGHLAQPLCTIGSLLGLRVIVLDDRPQFATRERFPEADRVLPVSFQDPFAEAPLHPWSHVVLVTRGHRYDYECLREVLRVDPLPSYIGMIGSRRRVKATFTHLLKEGFPRERLERVRSPIGLDIGGETPAEIAVSVAAEIVLHWRAGSGAPLRDAQGVLQRLMPPATKSQPDEALSSGSVGESGSHEDNTIGGTEDR
jgi:xanthine dehydrogenase accessory factor